MKKPVFKIGQKVKIINPEIFVRCGYPLTIEDELKLITNEEKMAILKLLPSHNNYNFLYHKYDSHLDKILSEIAFCRLKEKGFGGPERKIYTEHRPALLNKIVTIENKRVVKTGKYEKGYTSGWETPEYNPPFLGKEKSNVLLKFYDFDNYGFLLEIEEKNVQKID